MGFCSTFTTQDCTSIQWPQWFVEKYQATVTFADNCRGSISSKREVKIYGVWQDLLEDIHRAIDWDSYTLDFVMVFLHECGGIARVQFTRNAVAVTEPATWRDGDNHWYCYGCSDAIPPTAPPHTPKT